MGYKQIDLTPFPAQITPITPADKTSTTLVFQVSRTDTVSSLKCAFPADASILFIRNMARPNSNAGTSATVTINISNQTGVISTGTMNVQTGATTVSLLTMTNLPNLENYPLQGDLQLTAVYAETGTASTAGGPFVFVVEFVR